MKQQLDTFYFKNMVMLLNVSFNNISVIAWQPVLLVEETGVIVENHRPDASQ